MLDYLYVAATCFFIFVGVWFLRDAVRWFMDSDNYLFNNRVQKEKPTEARKLLNRFIPEEFKDDGCSNSLDSLFGFNFRWACRIHDWRYCSRSHPAGNMSYRLKKASDKELRANIRDSLPLVWYKPYYFERICRRLRVWCPSAPLCFGLWLPWVYYMGVALFGGFNAYNSCSHAVGIHCRHGVLRPEWMNV